MQCHSGSGSRHSSAKGWCRLTELSRRLDFARSPPLTSCRQLALGPCDQILDDYADLHELIQTGRLGDEADNSRILEQRLVSPGPRRTPHANWDADEVFHCPNLARDLFGSVLGEV